MSMKRNISIDGREVPFRASAAIPRIYRMRFHRDIYKDLRELEKGIDKNDPENSNLDLFSLEMFENIAYVMAKPYPAGSWLPTIQPSSPGLTTRRMGASDQ